MNNQAASGTSEANTPHESDMPTGWIVRRLKFLATCNDEALPETTDPEFEMEYVDISSVNLIDGITNIETLTFEKAPSRARRVVKDGDTIVSTVRTYLKAIAPIELPPRNMVVSTGFAVIRALEFMDSKYLGYALQNVAFIDAVVANSTGVSYPAINPTALVCLSMSYPEDKATQQQVAAFLDWKTSQIDALIAKKQELLQKLKEKRLAVITQAVTKGLNPDAPMLDSGIAWIGKVPEHWIVKRLKFIARIGNGSTPNREDSSYWDAGNYPWLNSSVVNQESVTEADQFVTPLALSECHLPRIAPPAVLVGITGQGKTRGMATTLLFEATINQHLAYVKPDGSKAVVGFLRRVFDMAYSHLRSESENGGSTKGAITCEQIAELPVPIPPIAEQTAITASVDQAIVRIDRMADNAQSAITRLTEYRTALITAATTGKIDVRQVKIPASS